MHSKITTMTSPTVESEVREPVSETARAAAELSRELDGRSYVAQSDVAHAAGVEAGHVCEDRNPASPPAAPYQVSPNDDNSVRSGNVLPPSAVVAPKPAVDTPIRLPANQNATMVRKPPKLTFSVHNPDDWKTPVEWPRATSVDTRVPYPRSKRSVAQAEDHTWSC
ncbi:hypothetical protein VTK56DRAFT_147 [Thermocarpiscus australiensis]